jgi:hypothetical protein
MALRSEWSPGEEAKHPNDCFAVREVAAPIYAIRKYHNPFDMVMIVSEMRYPCVIREIIVLLFLTKYKSLDHPSNWFGFLKGFLDCLHNDAVTKSQRHKIFGFENRRSGLLFGEEWPRFTQEKCWAAENYSGIRSKDSHSESSFCFICAPDTTIADWLSCFIPLPKADVGGDLIIWKNWRLTKALITEHCCVIAGIDSAPANVRERSHAVPDASESACDLRSHILESRKNPTIESKPGFWLIAACTCEELEQFNAALFDRLKVLYLDDQIGGYDPSKEKIFISHVFCSSIGPDFGWKVPGDFGVLLHQFKLAWLANFSHSAILLLPDCQEVAEEETVPFVRRLPGADSRFDAPADLSLKLLLKLGGEQSSEDEPFYDCESDSLRDLPAKLSVCWIVETGVCLIDATGPGKVGEDDSLAAGHGGAERNRRELSRAMTAISEAKARDLACVNFPNKTRILGPRDFAGSLIGQLSLARDELAAVKLSGRKGEAFLRVYDEIVALKTQVKAAQSQIRSRPILFGLSGQLENLNPTRENVNQMKVKVESIIELAVAMQTKDGLALIAYPDPKVSGRAERQC